MASASLSAGGADHNSAALEPGSSVRMPEDDFRSVTSNSPTTSTIPGSSVPDQEEQKSNAVQSPPPNALSQTPSPVKNKLADATSGYPSAAGRKPATPFRRAVSPRTLKASSTATKQQLSSAELEMAEIEKKRAEAKELAERNARHMKKNAAAATSRAPDVPAASTPRSRTRSPNPRAAAATAGYPSEAPSRMRARTPTARSPRAPACAPQRATEVKTKLSSAELEMAEIEKRRAEAKQLAEKNARFMAKAHKNPGAVSSGQVVKNVGPEHTDQRVVKNAGPENIDQRASVVAPPDAAKLETAAADAAPEVVGEAPAAPLPASAEDLVAPKETHAQDEVGGGPSPEEVAAAKVEADAIEEARIAALNVGEGEVGPESTKKLGVGGTPDVDETPVHSEDVPKTVAADTAPQLVGDTSPATLPASAKEVLASVETQAP